LSEQRAAHGTVGAAGGIAPIAIVWLVLAVSPNPAAAQLPALVELSAQYTPRAELDGAEPTRAQISSYQLGLNVPIVLPGGQFLIPGFGYHIDAIAYPSVPGDTRTHSTFHAPELSALFVQLLPNRWSVSVRAAASLAGGFETIDRRMIGYSALALASKSLSDRLNVGAGALVTGGFGTILPLPAVSVRWRPLDEVQIEVFVPAFASARYQAWNRVEVGARVEVTGNTYAIRDARTMARWPCAAQPADDPASSPDESMAKPDACVDHVSYTVASAGLLAGVRLTSTIWLTSFAGASFYRHVDSQARDGDAVPGAAQDLPRALFVRTSLVWRLPGS
jgi:hypothetical protein